MTQQARGCSRQHGLASLRSRLDSRDAQHVGCVVEKSAVHAYDVSFPHSLGTNDLGRSVGSHLIGHDPRPA